MAFDTADINSYEYPMTKMSFLVSTSEDNATAAFTEVTGIDASVDVIEFRQGNSKSLAISKIPGLVHHGNVTLKLGITNSNKFITWAQNCVSSDRKGMDRKDVSIELIDVGSNPDGKYTTFSPDSTAGNGGGMMWVLKHAFVTKLTMPDLDAKTSEIAIMSMEIAYEEMIFPGAAS